jgi:hypothetical protein
VTQEARMTKVDYLSYLTKAEDELLSEMAVHEQALEDIPVDDGIELGLSWDAIDSIQIELAKIRGIKKIVQDYLEVDE